jgi:hypothetical protein
MHPGNSEAIQIEDCWSGDPFVNVGRLTNILSSALVKISNREYSYYL